MLCIHIFIVNFNELLVVLKKINMQQTIIYVLLSHNITIDDCKNCEHLKNVYMYNILLFIDINTVFKKRTYLFFNFNVNLQHIVAFLKSSFLK